MPHMLRRIHVDKRRPLFRGLLAAIAELGESRPSSLLLSSIISNLP
jgi:hypothetical protein